VKAVLESERSEKDFQGDPEGFFDQLVVFSDYYGPAYQHSNGLSIYFPWRAPVAKTISNYDKYEFTTALGLNSWMSFLDDYFFSTRRPIKGEDKPTEVSPDRIANQGSLRVPMEKLSDAELLRLGPPPRSKSGLTKRIALLVKGLGTLAKETGTLAGTGKETATLAREMGTLAEKLGTLAKKMGTLAESGKETASLAKEMGTLEKEMATLEKETGTLAVTGKETATLGMDTGTLEKETGSLAKETATLGLFGGTVIKNFDAPEDVQITSRPKGTPNPHEESYNQAARAMTKGG
jgi:hypothetical protein